ncbi:MAG: hypothetical protein JXA04_01970 [Gammaproteobacteria bacterium]|nr:hypothetical protein [Gammaproteobacteria bacterium]
MKQTDNVWNLPVTVQNALERWFDQFNPNTVTSLSKGYQGSVWLFEHPDLNLVIKAVPEHGFANALLRLTLQHEYRVYSKLHGVGGVPRCYGLFRDRFLVLEYIQGETLRKANLKNRNYFYNRFFDVLMDLHTRNVAHIDLKRKNNIMVIDGREPCLIDFGTAVIYKQGGLHFFNHFLFRLAKQFDLNAWVKHKYKRQMDQISAQDAVYFKRTFFESVSAAIKKVYKKAIKDRK